jgi:glycosyltransferase involved in cell wall biosynthesis
LTFFENLQTLQMRKKIILVSRCAWTLYNFRVGLMKHLRRRGIQVIGGGAGGDGFEPYIEALGVPFVPLPVSKVAINPIEDLQLFWTLCRWYGRERPDIVHHFTIKPVIYGSMAARLMRVPRIINTITGLGFMFSNDELSWLRRVVEWQYRLALKCAHFTFFQNSEDLSFFLERHIINPSNKIGLLPGSGVDCTFFIPSSTPSSSAENSITFLMVARLLRDKGVYEFVDAARIVKSAFQGCSFQLLGRRDERNPAVVSQTDLDRWKNEGIVNWLGEVVDVRPVINQADVVVLPSYYREGIPRSLLEASAMAKPIITTNNVGCRQVVDDGVNGLLVPVRDSKSLAEAMLRLIKNPEMRVNMGTAGREKMLREFDESLVIEKIWQSYKGEFAP